MAEIKIEKKRLVWPWILLGLCLMGVLVYFLAFQDYNEKMNEVPKTSELNSAEETELNHTESTDLISVKENNSTVAAYVNFIETGDNKMGLHHVFTNEAILKLIKAVNAMAGETGYDILVDMDRVKGLAMNITKDPYVDTHADSIKKATEILTNSLQNIQKAKYPELANEVEELRNASEAIKPEVLTLNQRIEVKAFFSKAAALLKKMN